MAKIDSYQGESPSEILKKFAPFIIGGLVVVLVLVGGFFGARSFLGGDEIEGGFIKDYNPVVAGPDDANVQVVYAFDLQCPACRANHPNINSIANQPDIKYQLISIIRLILSS